MFRVLNSAGNLRGMVISKFFRSVWTISTKASDGLGLVQILLEFTNELSRMQQVWTADTPVSEKGPRLLFMGSAAILRGVTSVVPGTVHLAALSAEGYLDVAGAVTGRSAPLQAAAKLQSVDQWVDSTFRSQWDGENWYTFASQHLAF